MSANAAATALKALHVPAKPLILPNIWDVSSLNALISLNSSTSKPVKAVATASWAIAAALGLADEELSLEQNLALVRTVAPVAAKAGLPLSTDLQDGYGDRIEEVVTEAIKAGASGANIEDSIPSAGFDKGFSGSLYAKDDQVRRLKAAFKAAAAAGVPDFTINARTDVFRLNESPELDDETRLKEAIARGQAYLEAGATTIFVWGGPRGLRTAEVESLAKAFDGRLAVLASGKPGGHSTAELAKIGVARISIGPALYLRAMNAVKEGATKLLEGGGLA